ncbi:MAG TPA: hypothetical protein VEX35_04815 [Allosphingosinicella sp.]|nr:hypothetical protein [Allosphingosinicella sp.]
MSKSLNLLAAAALLAALGACNRQQGGVTPDDERELNNASDMLNDQLIDTSPDDQSLNADDVVAEEKAPEPAAANRAGERTANQQ